jgi:hypothetical protein
MKISLTFLIILFSLNFSFGQKLLSGKYENGLKLAYDTHTKKLTGYFENYTGWDEETKFPKFACIFYLQGVVENHKISVITFYPEEGSEDGIRGYLEIKNDSTLTIKLETEHGGCWNVQHFADEPVKFGLQKKAAWTQIKYVTTKKTFFYSVKNNNKRQKTYLLKNDFVCIDKLEGSWAHCTFYGKKLTKGWLKISDLN